MKPKFALFCKFLLTHKLISRNKSKAVRRRLSRDFKEQNNNDKKIIVKIKEKRNNNIKRITKFKKNLVKK